MNNKNIVITGATGTLGKEIIKYIYDNFKPNKVVSFARNESRQFKLKEEFKDVEIFLGDVSDRSAVFNALKGADVVIHAAAVKHIPLAEKQPRNTVKSNIVGSLNIIDACNRFNINTCIAISTDKACSPFNVYGMTKYLMERMFIEQKDKSDVRFVVVRYGNVMCSNGSVVPKWLEMHKKGLKLTVTDPDMTRFFFSIKDAVKLIFKAYRACESGEVMLSKLKSCTIGKIASIIGEYDVIGVRKGEKKHEMLLNAEEMNRTEEIDDIYMIMGTNYKQTEQNPYSSEQVESLTEEELKIMIKDAGFEIKT